jgi:ornithine decarboxylase
MLPELEIGDLVVGCMMGAYTMASATNFNSLEKARIVVLHERLSGAASVAYIG